MLFAVMFAASAGASAPSCEDGEYLPGPGGTVWCRDDLSGSRDGSIEYPCWYGTSDEFWVEETRDDHRNVVDSYFAKDDLSFPIRSVVHGENGTFTTTRLDNGESITEKYGLNWVFDFTNLTITYRGLWTNLTGNTSTFKDVGQLQGMLDFVVGFGTIDFSAGQHDMWEAEGGPFYFDLPNIHAICTALS
jgi:hypothetical protein